jgi:hypothetical protein
VVGIANGGSSVKNGKHPVVKGAGIAQSVWWLRAGWLRGQSLSPSRGKIFLLATLSKSVLGPTQSPIQWVPGAFSPGVKRPGREADH